MYLRSNRVLIDGKVQPAVISIENGKIREIITDLSGNYEDMIDLGDKVLMAGIVDPHVHINEPGRTDWEGFDTATKSALAGGITTLVDMPLNSSPVTTNVKAFEEKQDAAKGKTHCHLGFWGGVIPGNGKDIQPLIDKGVLGFKAFLVDSGIDEFPKVTKDDLTKAMPVIAKSGLPLLVHCEMADHPVSRISNRASYREYLYSRPASWEDNAIALMIRLCEEFNCRTHIVHLSSANSIEQIRKAKETGMPLTVETCPHYLYFNAESIPDGRTEFKCAPPIREKENNEKLWQALKEGIIDFVATDHSPAPADMKEMESGDLFKAWGGIASLQLSLPVMWTAAKQRGFRVEDLAKWLCENPAELPGLNTAKGRIEKGYDADLVVWDPGKDFTVTEEILHHRHKITPYMNEELTGVVEQVYLNGENVYDGGKFLHLNKGKRLF